MHSTVKKKRKKSEKCVKTLENEALQIDQIVRITKIPAGKLMVILTDLELRGILKNDGGKFSIVFEE